MIFVHLEFATEIHAEENPQFIIITNNVKNGTYKITRAHTVAAIASISSFKTLLLNVDNSM